MHRNLAAIVAITALVGCNADGFSKKEAQDVAEANSAAQTAAYSALQQDMTARSTTSELEWASTETGWTYSGTLTSDGPEWTGAMVFQGAVETTDTSASWSMDVMYDEVTVDGSTLDGAMSWDWAIAYDSLGFTMTSSTQGEITATGEANGTGTIDTSAVITASATGASATITGTVDGHEVDVDSAWSFVF